MPFLLSGSGTTARWALRLQKDSDKTLLGQKCLQGFDSDESSKKMAGSIKDVIMLFTNASKNLSVFAFAILLVVVPGARADLLGSPSIEGNGCPAGTVAATLSPDARTISIMFDEFRLENTPGTPPTAPKSCVIRVPVNLPPKTTLGVYSVDYRGYAQLTGNSSALIEAFTVLLGKNVSSDWIPNRLQVDFQTYNFFAPKDEPFTIRGRTGRPVWVRCGASDLTLQLALSLGMIPRGNQGMLVFDSVDAQFESGVKYEVQLKPCP